MVEINDEQIDFILNDIEKRGVTTEDVRYNILDHVCCIIENEMRDGSDFYSFYESCIARFYKKELSEIQRETDDLITFKYFYAMKKTVKIMGAFTALLIVMGAIFKANHWPGAGIMIVMGFAVFSLIFIPLNIVLKFRDDKTQSNRLVMTLGLTLTLTATIGLLFKVMHWPYANMIFFGSLAIFGIIFIPIYFITRYRNPETRFNSIIHTTFMTAGAGMLFAMVNLKPSHSVEESVVSMNEFQKKYSEQLMNQNKSITVEIGDSIELCAQLSNITLELVNHIDQTQNHLIALSNGETTNSVNLNYADLKNPNDNKIVHQEFSKGTGDYSKEKLLEAVEKYNSKISSIQPINLIRKIDLSELQLDETILSVILQDLMAIKIQAISNQNAILCYQKGLLAIQ